MVTFNTQNLSVDLLHQIAWQVLTAWSYLRTADLFEPVTSQVDAEDMFPRHCCKMLHTYFWVMASGSCGNLPMWFDYVGPKAVFTPQPKGGMALKTTLLEAALMPWTAALMPWDPKLRLLNAQCVAWRWRCTEPSSSTARAPRPAFCK